MLLTVGSSRSPQNLYTYNFQTITLKQLTNSLNKAVDVNDLVSAEVVRFKSFDGKEIPAIYYKPLNASKDHPVPAMLWIHGGPGGQTTADFDNDIQFLVNHGYAVLAVNNRGSSGYGPDYWKQIDYGGLEIEDINAARAWMLQHHPAIDPKRVGIIGWSHGGLIALLAILRNPTLFRSAAAIVPVTNLFHRLARKGVEQQRRLIDPQNRFGGSPSERPDVYRYRSPLFSVDNLRIPLLVHVADNDEDVNFDEASQLVDALHARKPDLADVKVYANPPGGHLFDRRVSPTTHLPDNTPDQRDSWSRVWAFFDAHLQTPALAH